MVKRKICPVLLSSLLFLFSTLPILYQFVLSSKFAFAFVGSYSFMIISLPLNLFFLGLAEYLFSPVHFITYFSEQRISWDLTELHQRKSEALKR